MIRSSWRREQKKAMKTDSCLLSSELELQQEEQQEEQQEQEQLQQEELYQRLLLQTMGQMQTENPDSKVIRPQPGMCVKTFSEPAKQKIFVNICQSNSVPPPPEISREDLVELLQSEDPSAYRVPMSLGEPHTEVDNNSQGCTAYDVVINQEFFQMCQKDPLFEQFVILVSLEGLENKYNLQLSRDWKVLKNRKFLGSVAEQNIRTKSRPVIQELPPRENCSAPARRPDFTLLVEPPAGDPEYLIAEIQLPGVPSSRSLVLDVGEDRLVVTARPSLFHLDICHPFLVDQENSVAQYNKSTEILTVTLPVVSS
ncbi:PIH1 domain-containing protein 1 isoform X1 [Platichthys flesus]|uniref:PIH1 domain-containing protein 1 isoform X1 n=2 Tax=Platichthys flesus TaxID=8260 RepID=UPI002DB8218A|nr:PIH1 domain-containing protein 1 isoform X1 [Platichthys flesus]